MNYRWSYYLTHPHEIISEKYRSLKWFVQRGTRGYSDCDNCSIFSYLNGWMPQAIRNLKGDGCPGALLPSWNPTNEESNAVRIQWDEMLEKMAVAFEASEAIDSFNFKPEEREDLEKKVKEGMALFVEWYMALWN